ncbi:hypothetical protein ACPUYX_09905 [Desulfosporosinus sp. SYSU MS00001]|uniref:hypothetical protein n=1 Tax=Desulfosporosinus sp. SYSU MS00001 TaxID=3416284 RepID=UPI003CE7E665
MLKIKGVVFGIGIIERCRRPAIINILEHKKHLLFSDNDEEKKQVIQEYVESVMVNHLKDEPGLEVMWQNSFPFQKRNHIFSKENTIIGVICITI